MSKKIFIGRQRELQHLATEIAHRDALKEPSRIYYVHGPQGIGKKTFFERLGDMLAGAPLHLLWIRPRAFARTDKPEDWRESLSQSMQASTEALQQRIEAFRHALQQAPEDGPRVGYGIRRAVAAGNGNGNGNGHPSPRRPGPPDPMMRHWVDLFEQHILQQAPDGPENLRIVVVLDNYDVLTANKKQWFARAVFDPLAALIPQIDIRFLLSGTQSFYHTLDLESYWIPLHTEIEEIELPPFSPEETLAYAREANVLLSEGSDLHHRTGGIPARIEEAIYSQNSDLRLVDEVEQLLRGRNDEQRLWILGAVHLEIFDSESLAIFGTLETGQRGFTWLLAHPPLKAEAAGRGHRIAPQWADAILRWQEQFDPENYRLLADRVEQYREVTANIRDREHRQALARLSVFNHFNQEALRKIYPDHHLELWEFVQHNLDYFSKSAFNYQIALPYQPFVATYTQLIQATGRQALREKVSLLWQQRREDLLDEIKDGERRLGREEKVLKADRTILDPILNDIRQRERTLRKLLRATVGGGDDEPRRGRNKPPGEHKALCITLMTLGGICLYIGILFFGQLHWVYILTGIALMLTGVFLPAITAAANTPPPPDPEATERVLDSRVRDAVERDTVIRLLNLKRVSLENKCRYIAGNIARITRRLQELETLLNEPYA